ncbi:YdcF family protein [Puia sp.]|jgi:hypothetical protein|uniref:YdcF family protein n=1 Tax=Puia sp. TaxID=2045100 RepID=UPI002F418982
MTAASYKFMIPIVFLLMIVASGFAQSGAGFQKDYRLLRSSNGIADKGFYWFTVIGQTPAIQKLLAADPTLSGFCKARISLLRSHATDTCSWASSMLTDFRFTIADSAEVANALLSLYRANTAAFDEMINHQLRPSGCYQRFIAGSNEKFLLDAWSQTIIGINFIIDRYGLGKRLRYYAIDSASYNINGEYYRAALKDLFAWLSEGADTMNLFFQPSLTIAMQLMALNDRDEAARFEPLEEGENKAAAAAVRSTDWKKYKFATIVVPGEGPELTTVALDPLGRMRCNLAIARYHDGLAPFIIVSGGFVHPFHTPYAEAFEMKRYLLTQGIPESAIIIEPQARHTTTNLRNANRLMIRYGIPITMPSDIVSTKSQIDYIVLPQGHFDQRNLRELGYLPYKEKNRISIHEASYYPVMESLHMDPYDPLDP